MIRIVSGGQPGADYVALDVALRFNIPCDGARFECMEVSDYYYQQRIELSIESSDAVLILTRDGDEPNTSITTFATELCEKLNIPHLVIAPEHENTGVTLDWILGYKEVHVVGPRESECPGIFRKVRQFLTTVLRPLTTGYANR